jgi:hypothetical protein
MADPLTGPITRCPWCSAELSIPGAERCLVCGAALVSQTGGPDAEIKGVTTLDTDAILRSRSEGANPVNRLLSFITGEAPPETGGPASSESLARPSDDVRREMLRLEYEARRADFEAEVVALKSDELARQGIHVSQLGEDVPEEPESEPGAVDEAEAAGAAGAATAGAPEPEGATGGSTEA